MNILSLTFVFALLLRCIDSNGTAQEQIPDINSENDPYAGLSDAVKAQLKKQEDAKEAIKDFIEKHRQKLGFKKDGLLPDKLSDEQVKKLDGTFDHSGSKKYYALATALNDATEAVLNGPEAAQANNSAEAMWTFMLVGMIAHAIALYFVH